MCILSIEYGNKKLSIYPDGGFINEGNIEEQPHGLHYDTTNVTHESEINLFGNKKIKFDVILKGNIERMHCLQIRNL